MKDLEMLQKYLYKLDGWTVKIYDSLSGGKLTQPLL